MPVPSNDPLAAQLNDLAIANSDGLLNDDEYRLLRQNLFERYAGGVEILSVSTSTIGKHPSAPRRKHVELVEQPIPRHTVAPSLTPSRSRISGVAGLLRRATGRSKSASPAPSTAPIKLSLIPRMFSKKPDDSVSSDTDSSSGTRHSSSRSFSRKGSSGDFDLPSTPRTKPRGLASPVGSPTIPKADPSVPSSPFRATFDPAPRSPSRSAFATSTTPSKFDVIPGGSHDIFDDDNLSTAEAIRKAIAIVEAEGQRLVAAFNDLETSAVIRYRREHPQRQRSGSRNTPSPTPRRAAVSPCQCRLLPAGVTIARGPTRIARTPNPSAQTALSAQPDPLVPYSRAPPRPPPPNGFSQSTPPQASSPSSWTARLPSLRRKGSLASLSSQGTPPSSSFLSPPTCCCTRPPEPEQLDVAQHWAPPAPCPHAAAREWEHDDGATELYAAARGRGRGEELAEVRRRRAEMVGRCEARLEYLRAKLKAQEIHERLLRK
ncbi:hypothetical protein MVEN_02104700 [Mycena venus]|uniref:Uncharacterized protein n=1 Tax=Mycena venus TaxID=2733690 RepID=A0A8H6X9T2_9AGAR|nr:hypothetical protein MVEN_02104700 [Mycena venus]